MRSRRRWRSRWTMKSSSERMRKEEMQLTTRRTPLAMESNRLLPSAGEEEGISGSEKRDLQGSGAGQTNAGMF